MSRFNFGRKSGTVILFCYLLLGMYVIRWDPRLFAGEIVDRNSNFEWSEMKRLVGWSVELGEMFFFLHGMVD